MSVRIDLQYSGESVIYERKQSAGMPSGMSLLSNNHEACDI
jgi:hypothetical protein